MQPSRLSTLNHLWKYFRHFATSHVFSHPLKNDWGDEVFFHKFCEFRFGWTKVSLAKSIYKILIKSFFKISTILSIYVCLNDNICFLYFLSACVLCYYEFVFRWVCECVLQDLQMRFNTYICNSFPQCNTGLIKLSTPASRFGKNEQNSQSKPCRCRSSTVKMHLPCASAVQHEVLFAKGTLRMKHILTIFSPSLLNGSHAPFDSCKHLNLVS